MTSLLDRDPTSEDLEAERDVPRPGVWAGEERSDLRAFSQDETDALIRSELLEHATASGERDRVLAAIGGVARWVRLEDARIARIQRGGIDSDPLVRVLARRAWGDRDRTWFESRGPSFCSTCGVPVYSSSAIRLTVLCIACWRALRAQDVLHWDR